MRGDLFPEVFGVPEGKYREMRDDFEAAAGAGKN